MSNEEISNPSMPTQTYTYIYSHLFIHKDLKPHQRKAVERLAKTTKTLAIFAPWTPVIAPANRPPKWGGDRRGGEANYFPEAI